MTISTVTFPYEPMMVLKNSSTTVSEGYFFVAEKDDRWNAYGKGTYPPEYHFVSQEYADRESAEDMAEALNLARSNRTMRRNGASVLKYDVTVGKWEKVHLSTGTVIW